MDLVRVCREGEAWPLAAGLIVGGSSPLIAIQTTGLFESGDAMRNVVFDLRIPVFAIVGARNWLNTSSNDSAKRFAEPLLKAWGVNFAVIEAADQRHRLAEHYQACRNDNEPGAILLAE